jgi:hypothetical protein
VGILAMNLTLKKHKENVTYQLVPGPDHEQNWHIRITDGIFNETVVQIGSISYNDIGEDVLNYNFFIVETPDSELTIENKDLQQEVGEILEEIIREAIESGDGSIQFKEKE